MVNVEDMNIIAHAQYGTLHGGTGVPLPLTALRYTT